MRLYLLLNSAQCYVGPHFVRVLHLTYLRSQLVPTNTSGATCMFVSLHVRTTNFLLSPRSPLTPAGRCDIERLLDAETLSFFGENTVCQWYNGSSQAVVTFNESSVSTWDPAPNITLVGR